VFRKNAVLGVAAGALVAGAAWTTLAAFDPQVFDSTTGETAFVVNPVTPRLSFILGQLAD
jgi:hypothetical protein